MALRSGAQPKLSRRGFGQGVSALAMTGLGAASCAGPAAPITGPAVSATAVVEYVVIGSGAGGGPVAANLARAGHRVILIEAGGDSGGVNYDVPAFHPLSTEDPAQSWRYFVRHYADDVQSRRDSKFVPSEDGVFYPRAGALGGCTAHHAMITVRADNSDWDNIASLTGDASWRSEVMNGYFERVERCQYRLALPANPGGHGFAGWLPTHVADPVLLAEDGQLKQVVLAALRGVGIEAFADSLLNGLLDPNDVRTLRSGRSGLFNVPFSADSGHRAGTREYIQAVARALPANLTVQTNTLVTRILFDGTRATGVEYLAQPRLYRADPRAPADGPEPVARQRLLVTREVILAAGAFNSPQLLKLSGIGPRDELAAFNIPLVVDLPGVGRNLQDRYEAAVVTEMKADFPILRDCGFRAPAPGEQPDRCYADWLQGHGVYVTNGVLTGIIRRSAAQRPDPDLFIFGVPGDFRGYFPGYSNLIRQKNFFTWAILKAHTSNRAGTVRLRSADPRDTPAINFHYFDEGNDIAGEDLSSVVAGINFVRQMQAPLYGPHGIAKQEVVPGPDVKSPADLARYVTNEAWGHHASCSNPIGPKDDPLAVVDSRFRVHGTQGLRIVDASVFPRIPGLFIVSPIYTMAEKASDVILADAAT